MTYFPRGGHLPWCPGGDLAKQSQEIGPLVAQDGSGSHKRGEAEVLGVSTLPFSIPEETESVSPLEKEGVPPQTPSDAPDQSDASYKGKSDGEGPPCTNDYADEDPVYDKAGGIYLCPNLDCDLEVTLGYCHGCQTKYTIEVRPSTLRHLPGFTPCL